MSTVARMREPETPAQAQMRQIWEAREVLKPTEVLSSHVPNWFRLALLKAYGCFNRDTSGSGVIFHALQDCHWLDHWGSTTIDGKLCFVFEPYHLSLENYVHIDELAKRIGCHWYLSPNSWWYPGFTLRVVIVPPEQAAGGHA